jgi:hypothetical protein
MKMDLLEEKQWQKFGMVQGLFLLLSCHMGIFLHSFVLFKDKCQGDVKILRRGDSKYYNEG